MADRGMLTIEIKEIAVELMGREITQTELQLMPYLQYCVMNSQNIDVQRVNQDDREILSKWRAEGYIVGGATDLAISKEFWDIINEILFYGYVYTD